MAKEVRQLWDEGMLKLVSWLKEVGKIRKLLLPRTSRSGCNNSRVEGGRHCAGADSRRHLRQDAGSHANGQWDVIHLPTGYQACRLTTEHWAKRVPDRDARR